MGTCHFKSENEQDNSKKITKNDFQSLYVIGRGGFGKVWKIQQKKGEKYFAMKEMMKARVIAKRSVHSVVNEKKFLSQLYHPLLVNMNYAFMDRENLYLVIDLMQGGDLRYHLAKHKKFNEEQTKFFIACMLLALEYLHQKSILHRDIKPENLVFDENGYLKITDLGIARVWNPDNSKDTSGTPGYMAPEVMCRQPHGVAVDYFAMGIIGYECMFGRRPYTGRNRTQIRDHILSKQIQIKRQDIPKGWSVEAADFINRLIQRKPLNRLGLNGPEDVKNHPWLVGFPWDDLLHQRFESPFKPPNADNFDATYTNSEWKDQNSEQIQQGMQLLDQEEVQNAFQDYYHDENFNLAIKEEKNKLLEQTTTQQQTRNHRAQSTVNAGGGPPRNDSSVDSTSQAEHQSKFSNYQRGASQLVSSSNNFPNPPSTNQTRMMKKTDQSSSLPQSQEQPSRAKKYMSRGPVNNVQNEIPDKKYQSKPQDPKDFDSINKFGMQGGQQQINQKQYQSANSQQNRSKLKLNKNSNNN